MSACQAGDRGFKSRQLRHIAEIAQSVEQRTENPRVPSSILGLGTITCGSSSAVEHRLAKARVAGSSPVFRSIFLFNWRHSQVVRQRTANPLSPVRIRVSPPFFFLYAGVAEQADARDLKSLGHLMPVPVRFRSPAPLHKCSEG
jgi:hypothetical protein